uniref:Mitochondrial ornithine transporter 1 n=1 Tax=Panagrellus redivivus TaxID=6233 RepID=A0A7E4VL88_PANRE
MQTITGTVPALVANIAENAVLFTAYGYCQKVVAMVAGKDNPLEMSPILNACAGSFAAVFAAGVLCPTELVKCKLQAQAELNPLAKHNAFQICRQMYQINGVRSFFVGMTPTLVREVPGYFSFFGAYEFSRYMFTPPGKTKDDIGLARTACSGAIGGMTLWTLAFPADVIKSRMQVTGTGSFGSVFFNILKHEGVRALYKGLAPTLIRTCAASSCLFIAYENTKRFLHTL